MPAGYLSNPLIFLVHALVGAYIFILIIRLLLQFTGADYRNPVSAFIIKVTQVPLRMLKPIFPTVNDINLAAIALMVMLQMIVGFVSVTGESSVSVWAIFIWSLTEIISNIINIFIYSIFGTVILSWVSPSANNPLVTLLHKITEPVLKPCQRLIPPIGGMDLSPVVALLGLQVLKMLLLPLLFALL
jgi:YggT family protein